MWSHYTFWVNRVFYSVPAYKENMAAKGGTKKISFLLINFNLWQFLTNKPATQAAGADPSWCNSTRSPPGLQNCRNFWPNEAI